LEKRRRKNKGEWKQQLSYKNDFFKNSTKNGIGSLSVLFLVYVDSNFLAYFTTPLYEIKGHFATKGWKKGIATSTPIAVLNHPFKLRFLILSWKRSWGTWGLSTDDHALMNLGFQLHSTYLTVPTEWRRFMARKYLLKTTIEKNNISKARR